MRQTSERRLTAAGPLARLAGLAVAATLAVGALVAGAGHARLAVGAAVVCATLVAIGGNFLLVRPMRRLARQIAELDRRPSSGGDGEVAAASATIASVAQDLKLAEWREARLGAIATGAARISHDLRGMLAPALLAAERLQLNPEPGIKRSGDILVRAVERATDLVRGSLDFARDGHQALPKTRFTLRDAVIEAVALARQAGPAIKLDVVLDPAIEILATREHVVRSVNYLLRNVGLAPATTIVLTAETGANEAVLVVTVDGPSLPEAVTTAAFQPFGGGIPGVELAIARDLARTNNGALTLERGQREQWMFRLSLPSPSPSQSLPPPDAKP